MDTTNSTACVITLWFLDVVYWKSESTLTVGRKKEIKIKIMTQIKSKMIKKNGANQAYHFDNHENQIDFSL